MSYLGRAGREPGLNHADPFETQYIHSRRNCTVACRTIGCRRIQYLRTVLKDAEDVFFCVGKQFGSQIFQIGLKRNSYFVIIRRKELPSNAL